jgi:acyl dehydratase
MTAAFDRPLWFDEAQPGMRADLGAYTFTRERIVEFARRFDPQDFHLDDAAAARGPFGRLSASGWHTAAAFMQRYVAHLDRIRAAAIARGEPLPPAGPSPGFVDMQWLKPVFAGDAVTYAITLRDKRELASRPDWGLVTAEVEGWNQDGVPVFRFTAKLLIARRRAAR